jgi:hypothetical protein
MNRYKQYQKKSGNTHQKFPARQNGKKVIHGKSFKSLNKGSKAIYNILD